MSWYYRDNGESVCAYCHDGRWLSASGICSSCSAMPADNGPEYSHHEPSGDYFLDTPLADILAADREQFAEDARRRQDYLERAGMTDDEQLDDWREEREQAREEAQGTLGF